MSVTVVVCDVVVPAFIMMNNSNADYLTRLSGVS
jgi:hypothetical protein